MHEKHIQMVYNNVISEAYGLQFVMLSWQPCGDHSIMGYPCEKMYWIHCQLIASWEISMKL